MTTWREFADRHKACREGYGWAEASGCRMGRRMGRTGAVSDSEHKPELGGAEMTARQTRILPALYPLHEAARAATIVYAVDRYSDDAGADYEAQLRRYLARAADALGYALVDRAVLEEGEVCQHCRQPLNACDCCDEEPMDEV